jgi:hypothetical protein
VIRACPCNRKFTVGQTVRFSPDRRQLSSARGEFKIVNARRSQRFSIRVKSKVDGHERIMREDQLTRS